MRLSTMTFVTILVLCIISGCSSTTNPVAINDPMPVIPTSVSDAGQSNIGVLGAYSCVLDPVNLTFEMTPLRKTTIGESFMVEGTSFFTIFPCPNCFVVNGIAVNPDAITLNMYIRHPFEPGEPSLPPSGANRLDLDIFDLAAVIQPIGPVGQYFPSVEKTVQASSCFAQDGYTLELQNVYSQSELWPYFLVVNDSDTGVSTFNRFGMGFVREFPIYFMPTTSILYFNIYLTFGYGASATFWQRLTPKYYNPEFNRKAPWRVTANAMGNWYDNDSTTTVDIRIDIFDWQNVSTVYPNPDDFANAPPDQIYSTSSVLGAYVEIPAFYPGVYWMGAPVGPTGAPNDPIMIHIPIANENLAVAGEYTGIVRIVDSRYVAIPPDLNRDCIISSPDGKFLGKYGLPVSNYGQYETYQTFSARVFIH